MRVLRACAAVTVVFLALSAPAQQAFQNFDHALYLQLDGVPTTVDVYAPSVSNEPPVRIGRTPCTVAIGFTWKERFGRRQWESMEVWTRGDACRAEMNQDKSFDLFFKYSAAKPGFNPREEKVKIATLKYPGFAWDLVEAWPRDLHHRIQLDPEPARAVPPWTEPRPAAGPKTVPTMIVATAGEKNVAKLGTVELRSNVEAATVLVNGRIVTQTPVNLMLPQGEHAIEVRMNGHAPFSRSVLVEAGSRHRIQADLRVSGR